MERKQLTKAQKRKIGPRCINCGTEEEIEYHHVVPLLLGGNDILENIVPLCHRCHKTAHCGQHISQYVKAANAGRKPKVSIEDSKEIFDLYISGVIGNQQIREKLGYSKGTPIQSSASFRKYLNQKGIAHVRNLVDVVYSNRVGGLKDGDIVGEVTYTDGKKKLMIYRENNSNKNHCVKRDARKIKPELIEKGA